MDKPPITERALAAKRERDARAAAELRKNLRKRKEQARVREEDKGSVLFCKKEPKNF